MRRNKRRKNKYSLEQFAEFLKLDPAELMEMAYHIKDHYHTWFKKKSDGSRRRIDAPQKRLREIQHLLLEKIPFCVSAQAHGGVKKKSIRTNALVHRKSKYLLTVDLKDAYPTVTAKMVYWFFRQMNTSAKLARVLAKLTTFRNQLPQGAPTSLAIFNALLGASNLLNVDSTLSSIKVKGRPLRYSRYVDDLTFSSNANIPKDLPDFVAKKLTRAGFKLNPAKTRFGSIKRGALRITGVNLINGQPKIPPKKIKHWRGLIGRATLDGSVSSEQVFGIIAHTMGIEKKIPNQLLKPLIKYLARTIVPCPKAISRQIKKQLAK